MPGSSAPTLRCCPPPVPSRATRRHHALRGPSPPPTHPVGEQACAGCPFIVFHRHPPHSFQMSQASCNICHPRGPPWSPRFTLSTHSGPAPSRLPRRTCRLRSTSQDAPSSLVALCRCPVTGTGTSPGTGLASPPTLAAPETGGQPKPVTLPSSGGPPTHSAQPERSLPRDSRPVTRSTRCDRGVPVERVLILYRSREPHRFGSLPRACPVGAIRTLPARRRVQRSTSRLRALSPAFRGRPRARPALPSRVALPHPPPGSFQVFSHPRVLPAMTISLTGE